MSTRSTNEATLQQLASRPKRADARRNYDRLLAAAREAFAQDGPSASLEDVARRAEVGIGTLYRNFPNRQSLLEAVYVDELRGLCDSAVKLEQLPPWEALVGWLRRFVSYLSTKQALAQELMSYLDADAQLFQSCRADLYTAGEPLLRRAQNAGVARSDVSFVELIQMLGGIAKIQGLEPQQIAHIVDVALDGLRYDASARS
ncbi:MAG: TetR/AcrR family transcriptional regulator [Solirubrobacteraceae bacterium]